MEVINARNVNDAWYAAKLTLNNRGILRPSRVGEMYEVPDPVTTKYSRPTERVLFDPKRDANPYFHFMEGLWMLAGRNDVSWIVQFAKNMMSYSDDGVTYHAAYGHRWRKHFAEFPADGGCSASGIVDQLPEIVKLLKNNHAERRAVLQMWNPVADLGFNGKDLPCNTAVYFKIRDGELQMTVTNRSNDIVWGCYGANCVHMSTLQEYMAAMIGVNVGAYHQVSDSWHAYTNIWEKAGGKDYSYLPYDPYDQNEVEPRPLVDNPGTFDDELQRWMEFSEEKQVLTKLYLFENSVFPQVATPMLLSWRAYKAKAYEAAMAAAGMIQAEDWRAACRAWLRRREEGRNA